MATGTVPVQAAAKDRGGVSRSAIPALLRAADPAPARAARRAERRARREERTARANAAYAARYRDLAMAPNEMLAARHEPRDSGLPMAPNEMLTHRRGER